ncbi:hypothetical protein D3C87_2164670 [compost metagenome]
MESHRLGADIHLDARQAAGGLDDVHEWRTVGGLLEQGFFVKDDAGDALLHGVVGAEQHFAIIAAGGLG